MPLYRTALFERDSFGVFRESLAQDSSLPLSEVIDDELFSRAFEEHDVAFGDTPDAVYTQRPDGATHRPDGATHQSSVSPT